MMQCIKPLTHLSQGAQANSADPDQTPQNAASDQVLRCLLTEIPFKKLIKNEK